MFRPGVITLFLLVFCLTAGRPGHAQTLTEKVVQVAARTIGFVVNAPTGTVPLAIVYDPRDPASAADARLALDTLSPSLTVRLAKVVPELVPVTDLSRLNHYRIALLMSGLQARYAEIADATRGLGVLTISADLSCVRMARCVMAVEGEPRVEIVVSREAAHANGIEFLAAFRILIGEM